MRKFVCVVHLTGGAFLNMSNNVLPGQVDQYIGAIIIESNIVPVKRDHTKV